MEFVSEVYFFNRLEKYEKILLDDGWMDSDGLNVGSLHPHTDEQRITGESLQATVNTVRNFLSVSDY